MFGPGAGARFEGGFRRAGRCHSPQRTEVYMLSTQMSDERATEVPTAGMVDATLEALVTPASAADRSKRFYGSFGSRPDADVALDNRFRVVQLAPTGSGRWVQFGTNIEGGVKD